MSNKNNRVPDRWERYSSVGNVVEGTRFLPFKTPLNESICSRNFPNTNDWFTPAMLHEKLPMVKIVIDLTFTDRYYNGAELSTYGIQHVKIKCPGGGDRLPPVRLLAMFNKAVQSFVKSNDGKNEETLIGVHCTHGLNRTGYFICNYMVELGNVSPAAAFEAFERARGHEIERYIYKMDIMQRNDLNKHKSKTGDNKKKIVRTAHYNSYSATPRTSASHSKHNN